MSSVKPNLREVTSDDTLKILVLKAAFESGNITLMSVELDGEPRIVICTYNEKEDGMADVYPIAMLLEMDDAQYMYSPEGKKGHVGRRGVNSDMQIEQLDEDDEEDV